MSLKATLRATCKQLGISYSKMNNAQMQAAIAARNAPVQPVLQPVAANAVQAAVAELPPRLEQGNKSVTNSIAIQPAREERNGVKVPSEGGVTHRVWLTCWALQSKLGTMPDRSYESALKAKAVPFTTREKDFDW